MSKSAAERIRGQTSAARSAPARGGRIAAVGDSILAANGVPGLNLWAKGILADLVIALGGRARYVANGAVGGTTSKQILASTPGILARGIDKLIIDGGRNDDDATDTAANIAAVVSLCRAAGVEPIIMTIPPHGAPAIAAPANVTVTTAAAGGTLAAGTYSYRVAARNGNVTIGTTLASAAATVVAAGSTSANTVTWSKVPGANNYAVYGRTAGAEQLLYITTQGTYQAPFLSWTDTGAVVPAGAVPASNTTGVAADATVNTRIQKKNAGLLRVAAANGCQVIDLYAFMVDPATGMYKIGLSVDGTHPTREATQALAIAAANTALSASFNADAVYLARCQTDASVIYTNPLLLTVSGSAPANCWVHGGPDCVGAMSTDPAVAGNVFTLSKTATSSANSAAEWTSIATGWAVGDTVSFAARIKTDTSGGGEAQLYVIQKNAGGSYISYILGCIPDTSGAWTTVYGEAQVVPGCAGLYIALQIGNAPASISIAQITLQNLTKLGLA